RTASYFLWPRRRRAVRPGLLEQQGRQIAEIASPDPPVVRPLRFDERVPDLRLVHERRILTGRREMADGKTPLFCHLPSPIGLIFLQPDARNPSGTSPRTAA